MNISRVWRADRAFKKLLSLIRAPARPPFLWKGRLGSPGRVEDVANRVVEAKLRWSAIELIEAAKQGVYRQANGRDCAQTDQEGSRSMCLTLSKRKPHTDEIKQYEPGNQHDQGVSNSRTPTGAMG